MKARNRLLWVFDPLLDAPSFVHKKMFGCEAAYYKGKLVLVLADGVEPWNGIMVCTAREWQSELRKKFPLLKPHKILGKWLYLSQKHENFEEVAAALVQEVRMDNPLIGVESKPRKSKKKTKAKKAVKRAKA